MKTKKFIFFLTMNLISLSLFAQTKENKIEKAIKDPKREENAAKADIYIQHRQRKITDSTQLQSGTTKPVADVKKKKKKSCRKS